MADWRAIQCQTQRETLALAGLRARGVSTWFPLRTVRRARPGRRWSRVKVPYFPGYLFADLNADAMRRGLASGVRGIDAVLGERPIPDRIMAELMARADPDGLVQAPPLKPGDRVEISTLELVAEIEAIDTRLVQVLVPFLGAMRPATIRASQLTVC